MKLTIPLFRAGLIIATLGLGNGTCRGQLAPASPGLEVDEYEVTPASDPLEKVNRAVFRFNDGLYNHALRPVSRVYQRVVPTPVRRGLTNFFDNLGFPVRFVSCALQAKPARAGRELEKFLLNSTLGVGGFLRVSNSIPALASVPAEDLGQTFGTWGVKSGPYLILPFFGPSSLRDTVGFIGDSLLNPLTWPGTRHTIHGYDRTWQYSLQGVNFINSSPGLIRTYDSFNQSAIDPYISVRNGYLQYRASAVKQ